MIPESTEPVSTDPRVLIRKLCGRRVSTVILLQARGHRGEIHLHRGRIVRALCGPLDGEQALFGMLLWPNPKTWIAPLHEVPELNVLSDLPFLWCDDSEAESPLPA